MIRRQDFVSPYNIDMAQLTEKKLIEEFKTLANDVELIIPGADTDAKKQWVATQLSHVLEAFQGQIPVIGALLNNPEIEILEENAVQVFVDWAWGKIGVLEKPTS